MSTQCRPRKVDLPTGKRGFQLESTAADVALVFSQHPQQRSIVDGGAGLLDFLLVDQHPPGQDQRLRPFAGRRQPPLEQQLIQAVSHLEWVRLSVCIAIDAGYCTRCCLGTLVWLFRALQP